MAHAFGEIRRFVRICGDIKQLELRSVNIFANRLIAIVGIFAQRPLGLPATGCPKV